MRTGNDETFSNIEAVVVHRGFFSMCGSLTKVGKFVGAGLGTKKGRWLCGALAEIQNGIACATATSSYICVTLVTLSCAFWNLERPQVIVPSSSYIFLVAWYNYARSAIIIRLSL
jgi:hypothetical protein